MKVDGPLFSVSAHGTLAGVLTFQRRPGRHAVFVKTVPANPNTGFQAVQRASFRVAISSWRALPDASKARYVEQARGTRVSGYNLYVQNVLLGLL